MKIFRLLKFIYLFSLTLLLTLLSGLGACSTELSYTPEDPVPDAGEITLNYVVDGDMELVRSVPAQAHEKTLNRVHLLFFDPQDNDKFVGYKTVAVTPGRGTFAIDPPETLAFDHPYKVVAVGNGDTFAVDGKSLNTWLNGFVGDFSSCISGLKAYHDEAFTRNEPGHLPFYAYFTDKNGDEASFTVIKDGDNKKVTEAEDCQFIFSRVVCRFDIHNLVGHLLDIRAARVVNSPVAGYYFNEGMRAGDIPEYVPSEAPTGDGYMPITTDVEPGINTTQRLEASLYGFPNTVNTSIVNDKVTSALMIAGYYIDPETGKKDTELTYYRFNMANVGQSQLLNRNYCYRATIKGVRRRGKPTELEAYNDATPIFIYDFTPTWSTDDDNVASDKDGNFLIVNKTHLTFQGDASDVDFVELQVSTNPELQWGVEWVAQTGNNNDKFTFQKISDSAVKCGPREKNDTPYLRHGYLNIVGTNPKTGKTLKVAVYLTQLSTQYNIRTLSVNGNTGTFTQYVSPTGGRIYLPVVTGAPDNIWLASDEGNKLKAWSATDTYLTPSGANNGMLEIAFPANITAAARSATIRVSLQNNELNADGTKKVPDVVINLVQNRSEQLMDIVNYPANGVLDIYCLSMDAGNPNGVINPRNFVVNLLDPAYRFRVTTNFDKDRDLVLSAVSHRGVGSVNPALATHPSTGAVNKDDKIEGLESGAQFWLNPFRTGPGDPMIVGNVTVEAYNPSNAKARTEKRSFTVRLISSPVVMTDVLLKDGTTYRLIPDRNYGAPSRVQSGGVQNPAPYYDIRTFVKTTNLPDPVTNTTILGTAIKKTAPMSIGRFSATTMSVADATLLAGWCADNTSVNAFYQKQTYWRIPDSSQADHTAMARAARFSKERPFFVSDFKINNQFVCCWLPINYDTGYAVYSLLPHGVVWNSGGTANRTTWHWFAAVGTTGEVMDMQQTKTVNSTAWCHCRPIAYFTSAADIQQARTAYGYTIP